MDKDNLNNSQTNTPPVPEPTTPPTPAPSAASSPETTAPLSPETAASSSPKPSTTPSATTPESPAQDTSTPLVDTSATPLVDTSAAAADTPSTSPATSPIAPPNPLATPIDDSPILGTAPKAKQSPILNSAPVKTKKFETKYMVPIIVLAVSTVGLAAFLIVELFILKPEELKTKEKAVRDSIPTVSTTTNDLADTIAEECETSTTETSPTIPFSSNDSIDDTGPYTLSANGPAGVSVASTNTSSSAQLTVNWSQAKTAYPNLSTSTGTDNYSITFTQPITDIYYGTIGEKSFFFFILKNGTVDYIDIQQSLNDKNFSVSGPINGVTNIAKFISSTSDNAPTVLAQKINGTYYDLKSYLE